MQQTKRVEVIRALHFQGKVLKVGDIVDLPTVFALEMRAAGKVAAPREGDSTSKPPEKSEAKTSATSREEEKGPGANGPAGDGKAKAK